MRGRLLFLVPVIFATWGCSSSAPEIHNEVNPVDYNLSQIGAAYIDAVTELGRPPARLEDLRPFLDKKGNADELLVSPGDGKPFVIVWNVDPRTLGPKGDKLPVLVYEQEGRDGKRAALMMPSHVQRLDATQFLQAYFPGGHQPQP